MVTATNYLTARKYMGSQNGRNTGRKLVIKFVDRYYGYKVEKAFTFIA